MGKIRSKCFALAVAVALVLALVPAAGAVPQNAGRPTSKKAASPQVSAKATGKGIRVKLSNVNPIVETVDIYRSTQAGVRGEKVNDEPVGSRSFLDRSARPGVQYYYTVVVASRKDAGGDAKPAKSRFADLTVFPQAKAQVLKADRDRAAGHKHAKGAGRNGVKPKGVEPASAPRPGLPVAMVKAKSVIASGTVYNANTTWTTAMSPIYVRGDVVVAAGKTLTIKPGVMVFFDIFDDGGVMGTDFDIPTNPTPHADLIVHGKLIANGTASAPITFSSAQASLDATETSPTAAAGDWGALFFDSMSASSMTYCNVNYGEGIWAQNTSRPYITNCNIVNTGIGGRWTGDPRPWGAVHFDNPKTDATTPRARFVGNTVASDGEGFLMTYRASSGSHTLDPYVVNNTIRSAYSIDLEIWGASPTTTVGNYRVRGYLAGNRLYGSSGDREQISLDCEATGTGQALIDSALVNNTVRSPDDDAIYAYAESDRGNAKIIPTISGGSYYAYDYGLDFEAYTNDTTVTNTGVAWASPNVSRTSISGDNDDGVCLYAVSAGVGSAKAESTFTRVRFESSGCEGIYDYAESEFGPASASPTFIDCVGETHDTCEAIYCEAYSLGTGYAAASPTIWRGRFKATDDDCVYNYAESDEGRAAAVLHAYDTNLWGYESAVYSVAYGDDDSSTTSGGANASTTLKDSIVHGYGDEGVYNYAGSSGKGVAVASPLILCSEVTDDSDGGLYCEAYSDYAAAHANPRVLNSTIYSEEEPVYTYAEQAKPDGVGDSHTHPTVLKSSLITPYYDVISSWAYTYGTGDAHVDPAIEDSWLENSNGNDCLWLYAQVDGTGTASVVPEVRRSELRCEDYTLYAEAYGPGAPATPGGESGAHVGGFFEDCTLYSEDDYAIYEYAQNNKGNGSEVTTRFTGCDITAQNDYGAYFDVRGTGPAGTMVQCSPRFINCDARMTGDGFYFEAAGDSSTTTETVVCSPDVMYTPVYATWDSGIYCHADTDGKGSARTDLYALRSSVRSYEECVYINANSGGTADAMNTSKVAGRTFYLTPMESWWEDTVLSDVHSDEGNATDMLQVKNMRLRPNGNAVWSHAAVDVSPGKLATQQTSVERVKADNKWAFDDDGVFIFASGAGSALLKPTVKSSVLFSPGGDGIRAYVEGAVANTMTAMIANNNISLCGGNGIHAFQSTGPDLGADSMVTISGNVITKTMESGIYLSDIPKALIQNNKVSYAGFQNSTGSTGRADSSGIYWSGAKGGTIKSNLIRGQRFGVSLESCEQYPVVNLNNLMDLKGVRNQPYNMWTDCPTPTALNAENNWWGYTTSTNIAKTIAQTATNTAVDFTPFKTSYIP